MPLLTKMMEGRAAIKQPSSFHKINGGCESETDHAASSPGREDGAIALDYCREIPRQERLVDAKGCY